MPLIYLFPAELFGSHLLAWARVSGPLLCSVSLSLWWQCRDHSEPRDSTERLKHRSQSSVWALKPKISNFFFFFFLNLQKPLFSHFGLFLALQERQTENRVRISKRNCVVTLCPDVSRSNKIQHHERGLLREKHCDCTVGIRRAEKLQKYKKARYVCYLLS